MHYLDNYLNEIGFRETSFRIDRSAIDPHSVVVLDALANEINKFVESLTIPVYRYVIPRDDNADWRALAIIPAFSGMSFTDKERIFTAAYTCLSEKHELRVLTWLEYNQRRAQDAEIVVETSNSFGELPGGELPEDKNQAEPEANGDQDPFTDMNYPFKKKKARQRNIEQKSRQRCDWRLYCRRELDCKYGYTKGEEAYFTLSGSKKPRNFKLCNNKDCIRGATCAFAHGEAELFCPTCGKTGARHEMRDCPESDRNAHKYY